MKKIDQNLLIDQEWTGTFFPPNRQDLSFAGRLKYSPVDGLRLEFARPLNMTDQDLDCNYLLGCTSTGEPLTLVGKFSSKSNGIKMRHGITYWTSTDYPFHYVIFGHHFDDKTTFDTFNFEISGTQEFFASDAKKNRIPYSATDIVTAKCKSGEFKVIHLGSFEFVNDDLKTHFHSNDTNAMDELQQAYTAVRERHPKFVPYLKKSLDYLFLFIPKINLTIPDAHHIITSIADLFALLSFEPAKLYRMSAIARDSDDKPHAMVIFPSSINDKTTIERSQTKGNYFNLPLNNDDVNLGLLIVNWLEQEDRFLTVSSLLQNKINVASIHDIHGSIVLSATQLEGIAVQSGATQSKNKYSYGLKNYASDKLRRHIASLFECTEDEIGKYISDIRNDIAHIGRPKKLITRINQRRQLYISIALQVVIIGYAMTEIGINVQAREKYQDIIICQS